MDTVAVSIGNNLIYMQQLMNNQLLHCLMLKTRLHSPLPTLPPLQAVRESDTWSQRFGCGDFSLHGQTGLGDKWRSECVSLLVIGPAGLVGFAETKI